MFPWISFISYIFVMAITPGPNNITSMNNAAGKGFKKGLPFNLGIGTGGFIIIILCAMVSAALVGFVPKIQFPLKILGAAYMIYLAVRPFFPSQKHGPKGSAGAGSRGSRSLGDSPWGSFFAGIVLQFVNAKGVLYGLTTMSSFILPYFTSPPVLASFAFLMALTGFGSTLLWSVSGAVFSKLFLKRALALKIIMGILLIYCAVSLFL
jgi:threonine/homoserine/homoserine lactone efflux protein